MLNEIQKRILDFLGFYRDNVDDGMVFIGFLSYKKTTYALLYNREAKKLYEMGVYDTFPGSQFSIELATSDLRFVFLYINDETARDLYRKLGIEFYDTE